MKKIIFNLKGIINFRNSLYLLLFLIPLFFQSCIEFMELRVSGDYKHQSYTGPSYPRASSNEPDLGGNIGFFTTGIEGWHSANLGTFNSVPFGNSENLYASNNQMLASFDNNLEKVETVKSIHEKISSDFLQHLRFIGGIEFVQKNSKDGGSSISLNYIQIPTYALYFYELPKKGSIFGGLGPYFAYGIGGKTKYSSGGQVNSFDSISGFKPFDSGLSFTAGYKMTNSFSFNLDYDIGLANISRNGDKVTNSGFSLNVSYPVKLLFKKK